MPTNNPISGTQYAISWNEFHQDCKALAAQLANKHIQQIVAVARGGLIPAGILARELNIRDIEVICLSSYQDQNQGEIELIKSVAGTGQHCLIVDDLLDTGKTAEFCQSLLPKAHIASPYVKPKGKHLAHYSVRHVAQDCWLYFPWDCDWQPSEPIIAE